MVLAEFFKWRPWWSLFCFGLSLWLYSAGADAQVSGGLIATESIPVYKEPAYGSVVVHTLVFGDQVRVAKKNRGEFLLIQYTTQNKKQKGYILVDDFSSLAEEKEVARIREERVRESKKALFFASLVHSNQYQGPRELQTEPDSIYELSEFKGATQFFAAGYEYRFDVNWAVRASVVMREADIKGESVVKDTPGSANQFELKQSFIGGELGLRYAPPRWRRWSFLLAAEYSLGQSIELAVLSGTPIITDNLEPSTFAILYGALAYRWPLTQTFVLEPALRGGAVVSTEPVTVLGELGLSLLHYF